MENQNKRGQIYLHRIFNIVKNRPCQHNDLYIDKSDLNQNESFIYSKTYNMQKKITPSGSGRFKHTQ